MLTTTLNRIRAHGLCASEWATLLDYLDKTEADDEPLSFEIILEAIGLDDAILCLGAEPQHEREYRRFAVWCARQSLRSATNRWLMSLLDVAERHANGEATDEDLAAAREAAYAAGKAAAPGESVAAYTVSHAAASTGWAAARLTSWCAVWWRASGANVADQRSAVRNRFVQLINEVA